MRTVGRGSIPHKSTDFILSHQVHIGSGTQPASYSRNKGDYFPGGIKNRNVNLEDILLCSQELAIHPYPETDESTIDLATTSKN